MQIVEALNNLGAGAQAEAELRRMERPGKRSREPEEPPPALKHPKLNPTSAPSQQPPAIKQEPTAVAAPAAAVANGDPRRVKREPAVVKPEGAAAAPLQAGVPANQQRYQQLQQHAAQHQQQQQQTAKPLRQVLLSISAVCVLVLSTLCKPHTVSRAAPQCNIATLSTSAVTDNKGDVSQLSRSALVVFLQQLSSLYKLHAKFMNGDRPCCD